MSNRFVNRLVCETLTSVSWAVTVSWVKRHAVERYVRPKIVAETLARFFGDAGCRDLICLFIGYDVEGA